MAFVAKTVLLSCVVVRGFFMASITNGLRTSWGSGRSGLLMIQFGQKLVEEVKELRREGKDLREIVAAQKHEFHLLKKKRIRQSGQPRMRYPKSEKLEIIRLVKERYLLARLTLAKLGIPRTTFYRWYDWHLQRGEAGMQGQSPKPKHLWSGCPTR